MYYIFLLLILERRQNHWEKAIQKLVSSNTTLPPWCTGLFLFLYIFCFDDFYIFVVFVLYCFIVLNCVYCLFVVCAVFYCFWYCVTAFDYLLFFFIVFFRFYDLFIYVYCCLYSCCLLCSNIFCCFGEAPKPLRKIYPKACFE